MFCLNKVIKIVMGSFEIWSCRTYSSRGNHSHAAKINAGEVIGVWKCLFDLPERTFTATCLLDVTVCGYRSKLKDCEWCDPFKICIGSWLSITRQFMGQKS